MKSIKKEDGWWVTKIPDCDDCGPYESKAISDEHIRGLQRTFDNINNWSFFTSEPEPKK
jgi:hypothetical protein